MARSTYIYYIEDVVNCTRLGFFTVKHEALSAIDRLIRIDRLTSEQLQLYRVPDGKVYPDRSECRMR